MTLHLFWIPGPWRGRLAIAARPRGGDWLEDETKSWRQAGLDVVVSLLEQEEADQLGLTLEGDVTTSAGLRSFPFPSLTAVSLPRSLPPARFAGKWRMNWTPDGVAVHCRQGIGRSGLMAIGALIVSGVDTGQTIEINFQKLAESEKKIRSDSPVTLQV